MPCCLLEWYVTQPNAIYTVLIVAQCKIVAALPAGWLADTVGRRYTIMLGALILIMAAAIQGSSQNVAAFIVARFFVGIGIDFSSVPAPVLITEIAHPHHRGKATSLYQTCYYLGAIASSWATFGTFNMTNSTWSWRIPSILQGLFPLIQVTAIWFVPESPRWLISKGRIDEARAFMVKYYVAGDANHPWVESEMQELIAYIKSEKESAGLGWSSVCHHSIHCLLR